MFWCGIASSEDKARETRPFGYSTIRSLRGASVCAQSIVIIIMKGHIHDSWAETPDRTESRKIYVIIRTSQWVVLETLGQTD